MKSWSFKKDEVLHLREPPPGTCPNLKLSLDEFYLFDPSLRVEKITQHQKDSSLSIGLACKSMRASDKACFILILSSDERLNQLIPLPRVITQKSLFTNHWPIKHISNFFALRDKIFYAFQERFKSSAYVAEYGLTQWFYIISGALKVTVIKPTTINLIKYSTLAEHEILEPEPETSTTYSLREGHFLVIPPGWISVKKAVQTTFALGGEILHEDCLAHQLDLFDAGACKPELEAEVRSIYWFYAAKMLQNSVQHLDCLRTMKPHLEKWRLISLKSGKTNDPYVKPSFFVPLGIKADFIVRELQRSHPLRKLKSLKQC